MGLAKHTFQEQNRLRNKVKQVYTQVNGSLKEEQMKQIMQQQEEFLKNNEFLREDTFIQHYQLAAILVFLKIKENQFISLHKLEKQDNETQNIQAQKFYFVFTIINEMIKSNKYPFFYMNTYFYGWAKVHQNNLHQLNQTLSQFKPQVAKFGVTTNLFLNYLIHSLNEYF